jgi:hypothetical protein
MSSVGLALALAGTVPCVVGCCYDWMLVSSLVNALVCVVLSCCRCLCFHSSSLCPPLGIELHVGTIIHTVPTASTYNTKVRFPNCIVQEEFFSRAREDRTIFLAKNNSTQFCPCSTRNFELSVPSRNMKPRTLSTERHLRRLL